MFVVSAQQGGGPPVNQDSRSEATSVCGDNSSVLSGFSGAVQSGGVSTVTQATSKAESNAKRDSLSSNVVSGKVSAQAQENGNMYLEQTHPPPPPPLKEELDPPSTKEW